MLAQVKWAGRAIDVAQLLLVSMHNYLRNTYLHVSELEKSPLLALLYYMINLIHATPRCHLMPTFLISELHFHFSGENGEILVTTAVLFLHA